MAEKTLLGKLGTLSETAAARLAQEIVESPRLMRAVTAAMQAKGRLEDAGGAARAMATSGKDIDALRKEVRALGRRLDALEGKQKPARGSATAGRSTASRGAGKQSGGAKKATGKSAPKRAAARKPAPTRKK